MPHDPGTRPAREDARLSIADLYLFDAGAATALVMNLRTGPSGADVPDRMHPKARYEFRIHLDDHDREDLTYRLAFRPARHEEQSYTVERLTATEAGRDEATGTVIARGYTGRRIGTQEGGQVWTGRAVEPFYVDLRQLHDVDRIVRHGAEVDLTRWVHGVAEDSFTGSTVRSIVLTVPIGTDGLTTGRQISAWATTRLRTDAGEWRQVGRTALPMMRAIFQRADGSRNLEHIHPADDPATYGPEVAKVVAAAVERLGTSDRPDAYADSVMERIVPDMLRYVVGSPAVFGFARFNGRRLQDNAAEVILSLVTNSAVTTGLSATSIQRSQEAFPFVVPC